MGSAPRAESPSGGGFAEPDGPEALPGPAPAAPVPGPDLETPDQRPDPALDPLERRVPTAPPPGLRRPREIGVRGVLSGSS